MMFDDVMQHSAGLRRPGAAALDLGYVAAGFTDGFFETGLTPWDVAAGSLLVTEAGGLIGNFTGEADFLDQRECVAGTPRSTASWCRCSAPYTACIKADVPPCRTPARQRTAGAARAGGSDQPWPPRRRSALGAGIRHRRAAGRRLGNIARPRPPPRQGLRLSPDTRASS